MAFFAKQGSTWKTATNFFVKQGSTWKPILKAYVKSGIDWIQFWPKSAPYTTTAPYFSTDTSGNNQPSGFSLNANQTYYLQKGTWVSNGGTISSYASKVYTTTNSNTGSGGLLLINGPTSLINYTAVTLTDSIYDGLYVVGDITATRSDGVFGTDSTDSNGYRYFVMRKYPPTEASGYSPYITSNPITTYTSTSSGYLAVRGTGSFVYSNTWNGTSDYLPDSTRSAVLWYSSINGSYTSAAQIVANATYISSSTPSITSNGTLFTVSSSFSPSSTPSGTYYYAVEYEYNSNSDYNASLGTTPPSKYAVVGPINNSPTPTTYPTLTAATPSGYVGNQNSFTIGATVTGKTGYWDPTPNGTIPIISSFKYSSTGDIINGNWSFVTSPSNEAGFVDYYQNQNHSFVLGGLVTSSTGSTGKYLEYFVSAENGSGANSSSDFSTNAQLIYPVPNAQTITSMTWTADNSANVTWGSLYSSDHYQLTYSTSSTTSSGSWTPIGDISYSSFISTPYSGLPSGTYYYSIISYNADGVGIYGPVFSYNSTPSPDVPTFTYYYGSNGFYNGTITVTANKSTSISATIYRSGSSSWGTTTTYDTAISYNTNKLYYNIPTSGYYYLYVTATNAHGSTTAYSIVNNSTFFYAGIPIGTAYQSVSASTSALQIDLSWTMATWQTFAPYTGDNITYRNNNASYEVYRSTSSATPATSVTPTYSGLTGDSYADTTGLSGSTKYYYWIRGRNTETYGGWVSMGNALTYTPPNPQPFTTISGTKAYPTGATQSAGEPTQNRILSTSWNASTNAYYYEVQYEGSNDNVTWTTSGLQTFASAPLLTTTYDTYSAKYFRYYRYAVRATPYPYSITYAAYSDYGSVGALQYRSMTGTSPTAPTIGTITKTDTTASIAFTINSGGSNTVDWIQYSTDQSNWSNTYTSPLSLSILSGGTSYTYYFRALNYDGLYSSNSTASFTTNATSHTVTFNNNGGSGTMAAQTANASTALTSNSFTRTDYNFNGWNTSANGSGTSYSNTANYAFTSDVTLYAQWLTHTVTFNANGGTGSDYTQIGVASKALTSNTFTRTNYTFNKWNSATDGTGTSYSNGATYAFTSDVKLYAQWTYVPPAPTIVSNPSLSGTGVASSSLTASNGSYSNATIQTTAITRGSFNTGTLGSAPVILLSTPYTVTGTDAAPTAYVFYAYDKILGSNGSIYYVYSSPITSTEPTISNPTVTHTSGTSSYSASSSTTPSGAGTITYYWCTSSSSTTSCTFTSGSTAPGGTTAMWSGGTIYSAVSSSGALSTGFISGRYVHCMAVVSVNPGTYYVRSSSVSHTAE